MHLINPPHIPISLIPHIYPHLRKQRTAHQSPHNGLPFTFTTPSKKKKTRCHGPHALQISLSAQWMFLVRFVLANNHSLSQVQGHYLQLHGKWFEVHGYVKILSRRLSLMKVTKTRKSNLKYQCNLTDVFAFACIWLQYGTFVLVLSVQPTWQTFYSFLSYTKVNKRSRRSLKRAFECN